jgi:hypothetical protein
MLCVVKMKFYVGKARSNHCDMKHFKRVVSSEYVDYML